MLPFHPLANLFPLIEGAEFAELVADVRANGIRLKIMLHEGQILDGRNRYRAAIAAGLISPDDPVERRSNTDLRHFVHFIGTRDGDPLGYVISCNLPRRHLDERQRAMIAAELGRMGWGGDRSKTPIDALPLDRRAEMLHVSPKSVERAQAIVDHGAPELKDAVRRPGGPSISAAAELAKLPLSEQAMILRGADPRAIGAIVKERRDEKTAEKKLARGEKVVALGDRIAAANARLSAMEKRFGVILADPPWKFQAWSEETGLDRAPDNHYPPMTTGEIMALPVPAHRDCVLFLWVHGGMLAAALTVMAAWGFEQVSEFVWDKSEGAAPGLGRWNRRSHELVLVGRKGDVPCPALGTQADSIIRERKGAHSVKPVRLYEIIENDFGPLPKLEMFARSCRPGWETWGAEAPGSAGPGSGAGASILPASVTKADAHYRPCGDGGSRNCGSCESFLPVAACAKVGGPIEPDMLCNLWKPAAAPATRAVTMTEAIERETLGFVKARLWKMAGEIASAELHRRGLIIGQVFPALTRKGEERLAELEAAHIEARIARENDDADETPAFLRRDGKGGQDARGPSEDAGETNGRAA